MMGFGMIFFAIFWLALIFGGYHLIRLLFGHQIHLPETHQAPSLRNVLEQRYARGEISREEYEQIKADLNF